MKKTGIIVTAVVLIAAVGAAAVKILPTVVTSETSSSETAYAAQLSDIMGTADVFLSNRYSGVVETKDVVSVKADSDKTIKETYVDAGDSVSKGDKLFEYDVDELKIQLSQSELDLEQTQSEISSYNTQIESLEKEKSTASTNQQLSLTNQIEALKLELKKAEYTVDTKTTEIDKLKKDIENSVVTSTVDGKIQNVGETAASTSNGAYITIATDGDYRIKALVSEENIFDLYENAPILVRSRIDGQKWTGTVSAVDTATPENSTNLYGTETTTKYPVYVELDSTDGLMVGQHVTIELNYGGNEDKDGLWLYDYYICDVDSAPYVWCDNGSGALEKRSVELGEYDEDNMEYEILSGLAEDDYIAFPEDRLTEGMSVVYDIGDIDYYEYDEDEYVYEEYTYDDGQLEAEDGIIILD